MFTILYSDIFVPPLGPVHTETRLAVYITILYYISVLSRQIRHFGSVKPLFFQNRVPELDKSENETFAFLCVQPIHIFCETMICHHPTSRP